MVVYLFITRKFSGQVPDYNFCLYKVELFSCSPFNNYSKQKQSMHRNSKVLKKCLYGIPDDIENQKKIASCIHNSTLLEPQLLILSFRAE